MRSRSRNTRVPRRQLPEALWWILLALAGWPQASTIVGSDFSGGYQSYRVAAGDSLCVAVRETLLVKLYGDATPDNGAVYSATPDIAVWAKDTFSLFWADSTVPQPAKRNVNRRNVALSIAGAVAGAPVRLLSGASTRLTYLHADKGGSAYLASFLDNTFVNLRSCNDGASATLVTGSSPIFSQCWLSGDDYLVTNRVTTQALRLKRVRATASSIATQSDLLVASATGVDPNAILGSAVAVDASGRVLVLWVRGGSADAARKLEFKLLDAAMATLDSGLIATGVSDPTKIYYYDDAPVVSYAPGAFAATTWNTQGVYLHDLRWNGVDLSSQSTLVVSGAGNSFPTVATNGRHLVVAWKGDLNGDGRRSVEGLRYRIAAGAISGADPDTFCFSDASTSLPADEQFNPTLNAGMDEMGSIGLTWPAGAHVNACVWGGREIYQPAGWWISPVQTLTADPGDSLRVLGGALSVEQADYGTVYDSVRVGTSSDPANQSAWRGWVSLDDPVALASGTRTTGLYLQYKVAIALNPDDSLLSPRANDITIRWDAQPRLSGLDSVLAGAQRDPANGFGDTVRCFARRDTLIVHYRVHETDAGDTVISRADLWTTAFDTVTGADEMAADARFLPATVSDTVYTLRLTAVDGDDWQAPPESLFVAVRNDVPDLSVSAVYDTGRSGQRSEVILAGTTIINVQQGDSVEFVYAASDSNDPSIRVRLFVDDVQVDSAGLGVERRFMYHALRASGYGALPVRVSVADPDSTVEVTALLVVNHAPVIDTVRFGSAVVADSDSVRVVIGSLTPLSVIVNDSDRFSWDTLSYRFVSPGFDSTQRDSVFEFAPERLDSCVRIIVTDLFGLCDTLAVFLKYPWLGTDSADNPAYFGARRACADSVDLVDGSAQTDSVELPLRNTGNDTMSIVAARFTGSSEAWLQVGLPQSGGMQRFDSLHLDDPIDPNVLAPGEEMPIMVYFDAGNLAGDGYVYDTLVLQTSDPAHPFDTIPIRLEYNDLPRLVQISFDFHADQPYWLGKRAVDGRVYQGYEFPPFARVKMTFSEPMDTLSAGDAVRCYSILDSVERGRVSLISLDRSWSTSFTELYLSPRYTEASLFFDGLLPPAGAFIPTDSVAFVVSSSLVDRAATAHGPNGLDVNLDLTRDTDADTLVALRVDSITFDVTSVYPANGTGSVPIDDSIAVRFNAPLYAGTIDTSRVNNRTLQVTSRYQAGRLVAFDSVRVRGNEAVFFPVKQFFFGDTVRCHYFGVAGRDTLGYPADVSGNGIAAGMFDSTADEDDRLWSFFVDRNPLQSFSPDRGDTGVAGSTDIELVFAGRVYPGVIDTALRNNGTLILTSAFSHGDPVPFDSIAVGDSVVHFSPALPLYYGDSIRCLFTGLVTADTSAFVVAPENNGMVTTGDSVVWAFTVRTIGVRSVAPADRSNRAGLHSEITVRFTDRIYPGTIDTDSLRENRSLVLTNHYSLGGPQPLRSVRISADSTSVTFSPESTFFSGDTVRCVFAGFPRAFDYAGGTALFGAGDRIAATTWSFAIEGVGFYVYPNPYKPGVDPRHCGSPDAPCGIVFKNLHVLTRGNVNELRIKVLTMKGYPVYTTERAGIRIRLSDQGFNHSPQWKWDTRNQGGDNVATGLYFYAVTDARDKVLKRGKLLIVR